MIGNVILGYAVKLQINAYGVRLIKTVKEVLCVKENIVFCISFLILINAQSMTNV